MTKKNYQLTVKGADIRIISGEQQDYISLTDIARYKKNECTDDLIRNWIRNRNTIEFIGIWEQLNNPGFNPVEFDGFRKEAGLNSFTLTPKQWIEKTNAIGIISKAGRYGGTYAHKDIAFAQLTQIPWGQNITKNLPDEFRSSLPSIEEIEAELSGGKESQ